MIQFIFSKNCPCSLINESSWVCFVLLWSSVFHVSLKMVMFGPKVHLLSSLSHILAILLNKDQIRRYVKMVLSLGHPFFIQHNALIASDFSRLCNVG